MQKILQKITSFLYPKDAICITCGALRVDNTAWSLCAACTEDLKPLEPPFCPRCGRPGWGMVCPECQMLPTDALDARCSGYFYDGTARKLVRALKYQGIAHAAEALADGMANVLPDGAFDALVPVPLHRSRQRVRGFNQAMLLSTALSKRTGLPVLEAVKRLRRTTTQTRLSRDMRAQNVAGAFEVHADVQGLSLLLIDDVLTTGATALACAGALKASGAARVVLWTAARADLSQDGDA